MNKSSLTIATHQLHGADIGFLVILLFLLAYIIIHHRAALHHHVLGGLRGHRQGVAAANLRTGQGSERNTSTSQPIIYTLPHPSLSTGRLGSSEAQNAGDNFSYFLLISSE